MAKGRKRCRGLRHGRRKRKEDRERKKEKGNTMENNSHSPSEFSNSKEEATLGADLTLA